MTTSATTATQIEFYAKGHATPEFLQATHIYYTSQSGDQYFFAEQQPGKAIRLYCLDFQEELYLLHQPIITERFELPDLTANSLRTIQAHHLDLTDAALAQRVFKLRYEDEDARGGVVPAAHDTVLRLGGTHATGKWFSFLVESVLTGYSFGFVIEYTLQGVHLSIDSLGASVVTVERHLKKLQALNVLTAVPLQGWGKVQVRFNREHLAGLTFPLAPAFFDTFLY
ncbi:hypothetical protein [Hymenobacter sp. BT730]|uniref:hypothetical protein n=1 Tax=Hymenobacter sp. BT730 TaxID=3063332 RepID=UPI0026DEADFC|nr:hypothetical protein [Hymenobacter sp. BT730]